MSLKLLKDVAPSAQFWNNTLKGGVVEKGLEDYRKNPSRWSWNYYLFMDRLFQRYLPRWDRIVDASCGTGLWVGYLQEAGYDVVGVDYAESLVAFARDHHSDRPVVRGDLSNLDFPDSTFTGYYSLGVFEHFENGPDQALAEAHRVLRPNGTLIPTVPYANPLRRLLSGFDFRHNKGEMVFFEYAFFQKELRAFCQENGFQIISLSPIQARVGLYKEIARIWPFLAERFQGGSNPASSVTSSMDLIWTYFQIVSLKELLISLNIRSPIAMVLLTLKQPGTL